ncbi:MAG: fused MFS/spermidine synthase [Betaproteobacteria bacterium]|nr:fused MFS/spermidine synthase [Betaproteobacteria bacterium]
MAPMLLYALTIFVSAFLLFLIQPVIAKQILPWFGGSAAVWTTCLVFFQCALLAGYFYSDLTTRKLSARRQAILHVALIAIALLLLPIIPDAAWKPQGDEQPSIRILLLLAATIGLPYFLLATTSPLVQAWFSRSYPDASPYRLFALSNLASMLALIGYPFLFEPWISTRQQAVGWSAGFGLFAALIAASAWFGLRSTSEAIAADATDIPVPEAIAIPPAPAIKQKLMWILLSALGSILLLAVSNHLTQNISSIPLLWLAPLVLYLITFILCFDAKVGEAGWYQRKLFVPLLAVAIVAMAWTLADKDMHFKLYWQIGLFLTGLFVACMFCHGELVARKPHPAYLTTFYLMVSVGGALGSMLVGVVAPLTLPAYFELEIAIVLLAALATATLWKRFHIGFVGIGAMVCVFTILAAIYTVKEFREDVVLMTRNFYGTLRVKEYTPADRENHKRSLVHGAILHGEQYLYPPYNRAATTYYKAKSGVGRILLLMERRNPDAPRKVGVIGLGTGTIAAYGNKVDTVRFYDINPQVVTIANREFTYLKDTPAKVEISLGDARLNLEREPAQNFDVLAIDAFSGDSIPVHLITLEALDIYRKHMKPDGVIAFHVSNRFLDLKPVVQMIAEERGLKVAWVRDTYEDGSTTSDWVLLAKTNTLLMNPAILDATYIIPPEPGWKLWTDDFNNIVQVMR